MNMQTIRALRRWWWLIITVAILGAALGFLAASSSPLSSSVLFRVNSSADDSARVKQEAQTASRIIDSSPIYTAAAQKAGTSLDDLRSRTVVSWLTDTEIVSVSVSADDAGQARNDANALAASVTEQLRRSGEAQYESARRASNQALVTGVLRDGPAEQARKAAVGAASAQRQDAALANADLLSQIGDAQTPIRAGLSTTAGVALGGLVGLLIGMAVVVAIAMRRRSEGREAVRTEVVRVTVINESASALAARCDGLRSPLVMMLAVGAAPVPQREAASLATRLTELGSRPLVFVEQPDVPESFRESEYGGVVTSFRHEGRESFLRRRDADVIIAAGRATETNLARSAEQAEVIALITEAGSDQQTPSGRHQLNGTSVGARAS